MAYIRTSCLPEFSINGVGKSEALRLLALEGAKRRYGNALLDAVVERVEQELRVISWYRLEDYFLIWHEIIHAAKTELDVLVGPGRGGAAGSTVNYCLGITDIDPLKYGLLFERFVMCSSAKNRPNLSVAGFDFDVEGRDAIVKWVEQRFAGNVAHISAYSSDGMIASVHASGLVLCRKLCLRNLPKHFVRNAQGEEKLCIACDGEQVEEQGLFKLDFLPMEQLSVIKAVLRQCGLRLSDIPLDDARTMQLFQAGDTGKIFMFDSRRMRKYLRDFHPETLSDLMALNVMHPRRTELVAEMIARKENPQLVEYILPCLADTLSETYGMLVYQEQIMQIAQGIARFTPAQADDLLRAIYRDAAGREQRLKALRTKFIKQGAANGHCRSDLKRLWEWLCEQGLSAFCKSHITCYTHIAYALAYLKVHHSAAFERAYRSCVL